MFDLGTRVIRPERMNQAVPEALRANLRDLRFLNRWFGGHGILRGLLSQWYPPGAEFTALDVGAASGDMGRAVMAAFPYSAVVPLDWETRNLDGAGPLSVVGDAFHLPFRGRSFDVAYSSLFLHHFHEDAIRELLGEMKRVCRRGVIAIDLERHLLARGFLPATRRVFGWHEITVHDGVASVEAGFRKSELEALARDAGFIGARIRRHPPWFRLSLMAEHGRAASPYGRAPHP